MTESMEHFVGIDVSKDFLDVAICPTGQYQRIANDEHAILKTLLPLVQNAKRIVLEASGGYEKTVFRLLSQKQLAVFVVNPRQIRDFAKATGQLAKTDVLDAKILAQYASIFNPKPAVLLSAEQETLKALVDRRRQLVETLAQEKTRLKKTTDPFICQTLKSHIEQLKAWVKAVQKEIKTLISSPSFAWAVRVLDGIKGLGIVSKSTLLADLPELGQLSRKEIAKLGGLAPLNTDSGRFKGKRRIWGGRQEVRNVLYMATMSARKRNPDIAPFYQRLSATGKPFKVVMTACMRKLLTIVNARLRDALQLQQLPC